MVRIDKYSCCLSVLPRVWLYTARSIYCLLNPEDTAFTKEAVSATPVPHKVITWPHQICKMRVVYSDCLKLARFSGAL